MSSSVSVVGGRKFLNACDIWFSFMSVSYMYLFWLVTLNQIKNGCPFIKHYINARSFKIIQLDARTGVLGQVAVNRKGFRAEFFSAKVLFNRVRILVERNRNIKLFKFSHDISISPTFASKVARCGFSGAIPSRLNKDLEKISTTAALDKDKN